MASFLQFLRTLASKFMIWKFVSSGILAGIYLILCFSLPSSSPVIQFFNSLNFTPYVTSVQQYASKTVSLSNPVTSFVHGFQILLNVFKLLGIGISLLLFKICEVFHAPYVIALSLSILVALCEISCYIYFIFCLVLKMC